MRTIKNRQIEKASNRWWLMRQRDSSIPRFSEIVKVSLQLRGLWDEFEVSDEEANLIELLNGPYWQAIILAKIARIKGTEDEG